MLERCINFFFALTTILQPTRALKFQVHFFLRGRLKRLKTATLQDRTFQDHFFNTCPRSLQLSSSYTINHDDELESLFLSGNLELFLDASSHLYKRVCPFVGPIRSLFFIRTIFFRLSLGKEIEITTDN